MSGMLFAHSARRRRASHGWAQVTVFLLAGVLWSASPAFSQPDDPSFRLVVDEGTPLRVALDRRVVIKRVGQPIEAVLVDPVFAYDRIVIPAGTRVLGRMIGISAGPLVELSELSHPRVGGSIGVWGFLGITPFARLGTVQDLGMFGEVGVHIALPVFLK